MFIELRQAVINVSYQDCHNNTMLLLALAGVSAKFNPCPNNRSDGVPQCADGHEGPLCAHCSFNYARSGTDGPAQPSPFALFFAIFRTRITA